ncbi:MAG: alpha/beta hydrolase [Acidobacteria bacterium]|nr:alpha/beta hydrolase [Acidobacteriota bacterium]
MNRFLNFVSISLSTLALLSVIWIIVPAPSFSVWLFSVAVSEWSLWFGALALTGIICSVFVRIAYGTGNTWFVSVIIGSLALIISFYPLFSVISAARRHNVSLSLSQYFSGLRSNNNFSETESDNFTTYSFAQVDGQDLRLDVYLPTNETTNKGAGIIVVHGGSWRSGKRSDFPQWNQWLTKQGFVVFDVDYRLAPQPNYLTATGDVKCAVRWVKENAAKFKIAPDRIALFGRSAGAQLALLAAYSASDARLPASCSEKESSADVRAVVSLYAPTDLLWDYDNPANQFVINGPATLADFLGGNPHESDEMRNRFILASPVAHVTSATPPTLLIHGGQDQLVRSENLKLLADKLKEADVPHKTLFIPYAQHGFDYNFNGWGAQIVKPVISEFLRENTKAR